MRVLGLIPARGGSKRLPRKNILPCFGKPLIAWTIEAANKSRLITETWVSTEDMEIGRVALDYGSKVLHRPKGLAQDDTTTEAVIEHALSMLPDFDWICLLQATSPTRTHEDIDRCVEAAIQHGQPVFSSTDSRQPNGAIYVWKGGTSFEDAKKIAFLRALHCIDIDTSNDFVAAAQVLEKQSNNTIRSPSKDWWLNV